VRGTRAGASKLTLSLAGAVRSGLGKTLSRVLGGPKI
jgi:hypothetical protein